jgi:hypothetical protein
MHAEGGRRATPAVAGKRRRFVNWNTVFGGFLTGKVFLNDATLQ